MIVVSDTGPLNYLTRIGHLNVLPALYGQVIIPQAVADELSGSASPEEIQNLVRMGSPWLRIERVSTVFPDLTSLGEGEQQAIALAKALGANLLLCDDKGARRAAFRNHLQVTGTLGVLQEAAANGMLDFSKAIEALRSTNFRISKTLMDRILRAAGRDL